MQPLATVAQVKELDRIAIQERGVPSLELMERAAQAVAQAVRELLGALERRMPVASSIGVIGHGDTPQQQEELDELRSIVESRNTDRTFRIAVFCGPGNNGGDGLAAARLLREAGYTVRVFRVGDWTKQTPDAKQMEKRLLELGVTPEPFEPDNRRQTLWLHTCDCILDAMLGVGLKRPVEGDVLAAVEAINLHRFCPVVACDIPTGLDGDTGAVLGEAVHAKVTVTFTCAKVGLYLGQGRAYSGKVEEADIGVPFDLVSKLVYRGAQQIQVTGPGRYVLPRRPRTAHKGDFGRVFILGGGEGYTGAPVLAARGALRTGAGLVYLGVPREIYHIVASKCDESMPFPLEEEYAPILEKAAGCDVALIGPGLGQSPKVQKMVLALLAGLKIPVVLDADGINALTGHIDILDKRSAPTVLTPHDGEFQRLTGCSLPIADRLGAAREFSKSHSCTLVLKGHATITASPDGKAWINATGNPGMATGGSGDVLAGMLAALLGQKHLNSAVEHLPELVAMGVCYHGMAGDLCAKELGEYAMLPSDLVEMLPRVLMEQEERERSLT